MVLVISNRMFELAQHFWLPWTLLMNFSIFQYLVPVYLHRRREHRVALLIASAFLGFASLTFFFSSDEDFVNRMNDISEICCVLTFFIQITIIGSDVVRKVKIPSRRWMTRATELFILAGFFVIVINVLADFASLVSVETLDSIVENLSLVFIGFFRFYYLSLSQGGFRQMAQSHKLKIAVCALLVTHEYPFMVLNRFTDMSWEFVQAVYMRVFIVVRLTITIRDKLRGDSRGKSTSQKSAKTAGDRRMLGRLLQQGRA